MKTFLGKSSVPGSELGNPFAGGKNKCLETYGGSKGEMTVCAGETEKMTNNGDICEDLAGQRDYNSQEALL